jgi:hypothetical protein
MGVFARWDVSAETFQWVISMLAEQNSLAIRR